MDAFSYDYFRMYEFRQDIVHMGGHMIRRNVHAPIMERRLAHVGGHMVRRNVHVPIMERRLALGILVSLF